MKVLRLAQYVHNNLAEEFQHNISGYSRSVWDISRFSAKSGNEEYLFSYSNKESKKIEGVNIISGQHYNFLSHIESESMKDSFKLINSYNKFKKSSFKAFASIVYYNLAVGYIKKIIDTINPDIIHIHGLTFNTSPFLKAAQSFNYPYIVTLHGLNMEIAPNPIERNYEIKLIEEINAKNNYITVIGSGMIPTIEKNCFIKNSDKIVTINHGIDPSHFDLKLNKKDIKKDWDIVNKKVIIQVGSISDRRNQLALIESVALMDEEILANLKVYIIGDGPLREELEKKVKELDLINIIDFVGYKNSDELAKFYTVADLTAVLSKVEGFGRPILESYAFGVPVVAFKDLDAVNDLYKENCMFLIKERKNEAIAKRILQVLQQETDSKQIVEYSKTKTWDSAVEKYNEVYNSAIIKLRGSYNEQ